MSLRSFGYFLLLLLLCFRWLVPLSLVLPGRLALPLLVRRSLEDPHLLFESLVLNLVLLHLTCFVLDQQVFDVGLPLSLGFSMPGMQFVLELVDLFFGHFIFLMLIIDGTRTLCEFTWIELVWHLLVEVEF